MESSIVSRLLQDARLLDSYASSGVLASGLDIRRTESTPTALLARSPKTPGSSRSPNTPDSARQPFTPWGSQPALRLEIHRTTSTSTAPLARSPTRSGSSRQPFDPWGSQESPARSFQERTKSEIGVREVQDRAAGSRSRTGSSDSDSVRGLGAWTRTSSTDSERSESEHTAPAEATSSKPQRTLVSHAMAEQLFADLLAGHWEEAEDMLMMAGHPPLATGLPRSKETATPPRTTIGP